LSGACLYLSAEWFIALFVERSGCKRNRLKRRVGALQTVAPPHHRSDAALTRFSGDSEMFPEFGADGSGFWAYPEDPNPLEAVGPAI
jgi:hypothetical protein